MNQFPFRKTDKEIPLRKKLRQTKPSQTYIESQLEKDVKQYGTQIHSIYELVNGEKYYIIFNKPKLLSIKVNQWRRFIYGTCAIDEDERVADLENELEFDNIIAEQIIYYVDEEVPQPHKRTQPRWTGNIGHILLKTSDFGTKFNIYKYSDGDKKMEELVNLQRAITRGEGQIIDGEQTGKTTLRNLPIETHAKIGSYLVDIPENTIETNMRRIDIEKSQPKPDYMECFICLNILDNIHGPPLDQPNDQFICRQGCKPYDAVKICENDHIVHRICILRWCNDMRQLRHNECPLCTNDLIMPCVDFSRFVEAVPKNELQQNAPTPTPTPTESRSKRQRTRGGKRTKYIKSKRKTRKTRKTRKNKK